MKTLFASLLFCTAVFAQPCTQIADTNVWSLGGAANGTITLHLGGRYVFGGYTYPQSDVTLTVTAGTLYGPSGSPGYCAPPGAVMLASYRVQRIGSGSAGSVPSTATWTIPVSGGPYTISQIETGVVTPPVGTMLPLQIAGGRETYSLRTIGGASKYAHDGALAWSDLNSTPWSALNSVSWLDIGAPHKPSVDARWQDLTGWTWQMLQGVRWEEMSSGLGKILKPKVPGNGLSLPVGWLDGTGIPAGTYCLNVSAAGAISLVACSGSSSVHWSSLSSGQWASLNSAQWAALAQ